MVLSLPRRRVLAGALGLGAVRWRRDLENWLAAVVVAGETVLAGTRRDATAANPPRPDLRALTLDGDERWRFETPENVRGLAAVGDAVFLGTGDASGGTVYALR